MNKWRENRFPEMNSNLKHWPIENHYSTFTSSTLVIIWESISSHAYHGTLLGRTDTSSPHKDLHLKPNTSGNSYWLFLFFFIIIFNFMWSFSSYLLLWPNMFLRADTYCWQTVGTVICHWRMCVGWGGGKIINVGHSRVKDREKL